MILTVTYKTHLYKRVFCLLLCVFLCVFTVLMQYQEAQAFVPIAALLAAAAPEVAEVVGSILVACGLTFATNEAVDTASKWFWSSCAPSVRSSISSAASSIANGATTISSDVWNAVKAWVNANFNAGSNTVQSPYLECTLDGVVYPYSVVKNTTFSLGSTFVIPSTTNYSGFDSYKGQTIYLDQYTASNGKKYWAVLINGTVYNGSNASSDNLWYLTRYCNANTGYDLYLYRESGIMYLRVAFLDETGALVNYKLGAIQNYTTPISYPSVTATGKADVVDNSTYDIANNGVRSVAVPATTADLLNKTNTDVLTTTTPGATTAPTTGTTVAYPNTWTGSFKGCSPTCGDYTFTGTGTITGTMDYSRVGTWAGVWSWSATGARVWTGTYTDAAALTWTGTATEERVAVVEGSINWEPLKVAGIAFTNKFPFSLPWDLWRSFSTVSAEGKQPDFDITIPDTKLLKGFSFKVDLSMWSGLIRVSKAFELVAFDIGLIIITRRLLGGAT